MKTTKEISDLLYEKLSNVYCTNCRFVDDFRECDDCNRKNMYWSISRECCDEVAAKITEAEK